MPAQKVLRRLAIALQQDIDELDVLATAPEPAGAVDRFPIFDQPPQSIYALQRVDQKRISGTADK
jgi:hypothetical protein